MTFLLNLASLFYQDGTMNESFFKEKNQLQTRIKKSNKFIEKKFNNIEKKTIFYSAKAERALEMIILFNFFCLFQFGFFFIFLIYQKT